MERSQGNHVGPSGMAKESEEGRKQIVGGLGSEGQCKTHTHVDGPREGFAQSGGRFALWFMCLSVYLGIIESEPVMVVLFST